ncbi:MAG: SwmB domain-containing protein, partial [Chloroflexi bacterium]|nr:SwmB domain-containing protein [Chloroflexota bacterium]
MTADFAPDADLTVNLTVADAAGSDFVAEADQFAQTVTITMGSTSASHSVPTVDDAVDEPDGSVTVTLEPHADYLVGDPSSAEVRVNDGDLPADTLVSNNERTPYTESSVGFSTAGISSFATTFSTGSPGAVLSAVDLRLGAEGVGSEAALQVSLYSTTAAGAPDASLFVFDNPVGFNAGTVNTFTVPTDAGAAATLAATTTYAIVLETTSTVQNRDNRIDIAFSHSDGEDPGAASGWSIADVSQIKTGSGSWGAVPTGHTATIGVRGTLLDAAAPTFSSAKVDGARLVIVFSEDLDPESVPAPGAFAVQVAGSARTVADGGVRIDESAVTLTLSSAVTAGQTVTVAYTKPSNDPLQDLSGNPVATFTAQSVTVRLANAPEDLDVEAANNLDLIVRWEPPASLPANHAVTGYTVEWTPAGGSATTAAVASNFREHYITGLTEGAAYTARVRATITNSTDPANPVESMVWSVTSAPVTIWQEPIVGWLVDGTPNINRQIGRIFMMSDNNMIESSAKCDPNPVGGGANPSLQNCPPRTLVSSDVSTGDNQFYSVTVTVTAGANSSTLTSVGQVGGSALSSDSDGVGVNSGTVARASGGNARLVVGWTRISSDAALGNIDAVVVETRRRNNDGSWPDWTQTVIPGALAEVKEGSHAFNGLDSGTYQVRVRGRADGDDGDANTTDTPRLGFTTPVQTVTVAAANTNRAGSPTGVKVTGTGTTRTVTWEPPTDATTGAVVYGYQVRHRETTTSNDGDWTDSDELYIRQMRRYCNEQGGGEGEMGVILPSTYTCTNPRSFTITGLTSGTDYDVEVVALNANSALADDMTAPSFSAAAVNGTALTLSFDEDLDPNSAPAPGDFTVTVGTDRRDVAPDGVATRGATVTLTLESPVLAADTVKVAYTAGANPLRDPAVNAVETFGDQSVVNTTGAAVSNAGQAADVGRRVAGDLAQAFTTGSHPGGYTLSRVDLPMMKSGTDVPTYSSVGIHADASSVPGASVGTLSNPSGVPTTRGLVPLNASAGGIALEPNTTYWLVIDISGITTDQTIESTSSDARDAGGAKGWSIADGLLVRSFLLTDWTSAETGSDVLQMVVHATPNPTTVLVGNFGQPDGGVSAGSLTLDYAQAFTTGAADHGWVLTQLDLFMQMAPGQTPQTYTLKIHADSTGTPGSEEGTLTNPTGITSTGATHSFTTEGLELAAERTYWAVLDVTASPSDPGLRVARTAGKGEDAGAPDGWTIANSNLHRALAAPAWNTDTTRVLKIAIHGSEVTAQKLVGNTETGAPEQDASFTVDNAISFTTGSHGAGYELTSVGLRLKSSASTPPVYTVRIEGDANSLPDGTSLGELTSSASLSGAYALIEFEASGEGIDLAAGTTYWVVFDVSTGDNDSHVAVVVTRNEDAGGAAGWSIGDASYFRMQDDSNQWSTTQGSHPTALAVYGNIKPDTTEPEFVSAAVDGATLTVTFNEDLDATSVPAPGDFTVTVGADRRDVAAGGVAIAGDTVTLTLSSPVLAVDAVQVRYTA